MTSPISKQDYLTLLLETSRAGGFPAADPGARTCRYRTKDGRKCAFGLLIPDEKYSPNMEGQAANVDLFYSFPDCFTPVEGLKADGCSALSNDYRAVQACHDDVWAIMNPNRLRPSAGLAQVRAWDHDMFVRKLKGLPCFRGCVFPES